MDRSQGQGKRKRHEPIPSRMLTRVNYFAGHLLSAEDFSAEQDYVREKLRRHNRTMHQPEVVDGLEVTLESPGVRVAPGLALDAAGNEICVPLAQGAQLPSIAGEVYLVLRYKEIGSTQSRFSGHRARETPIAFPRGFKRASRSVMTLLAGPTPPLRRRTPRRRFDWRDFASREDAGVWTRASGDPRPDSGPPHRGCGRGTKCLHKRGMRSSPDDCDFPSEGTDQMNSLPGNEEIAETILLQGSS